MDLGLFKDPISDNHLRFRTKGDVVAALDKQAITINKPTNNPLKLHAFDGFGDTGKTGGGINKQIILDSSVTDPFVHLAEQFLSKLEMQKLIKQGYRLFNS